MNFQPADYCLGALIVVCAVTGLFRGLSGTLAFFAAVVISAGVAVLGWNLSGGYFEETFLRALAVLAATLLAFGIVRFFVKKMINGLLAQPSDALFGFLTGLVMGCGVLVIWAYSGFYIEYSTMATLVAGFIR